jgi:pSer/pThr/pTyr-binding forkhead associated (FHA) protein
MAELELEIVEGPGAGLRATVDRELVIGRAEDADIVLADSQVSRRHARLAPDGGGGVVVEDLGSSNGTFINQQQLHAPALLRPGDDLLVGVTVLEVRSPAQVAAQSSAVRVVPPALAVPERRPTFVDRVDEGPRAALNPELETLRDARVRFQARTAPLAIAVLVVLVVAIYLAAR